MAAAQPDFEATLVLSTGKLSHSVTPKERRRGSGSHIKHLQRTEEQLAEGLNVVPKVACRPVMFDFDFGEPFPFGSPDRAVASKLTQFAC